MASYWPPKKNVQFIVYVGLESVATAGAFQASATIASGDFKTSGDGGTLGNLTTLPTVTPAAGKMVKITLSAAEMNFDNVTVVCSDAAGAEWKELIINLATVINQNDDLATPTNITAGTITTATNVTTVNGLAANVITAAAIATDAIDADALKTDAITEIQAGLATPTNITAGTITTVTNLTNAPTNGDLTPAMKTSVTTAATAATPIAASVAGAVGSVAGNVGGNVVGSVGSVTGAVGSVTGNVGGNVVGSVGSLATQAKADVNAEADAAILDAALVAGQTVINSKLGAPTNVSLSADIAAVKSDTGALNTTIGAAGAGLTAVASTGSLATVNATVNTLNTKLGSPSGTVSSDIAVVHTDTGDIKTRLPAVLSGGKMDSVSTGNVTLSTATMQQIADEILKRGVSNVEETAATGSLAEMILSMFESAIADTTWTIRKTNGNTFNMRTITTDDTAVPIVGVT